MSVSIHTSGFRCFPGFTTFKLWPLTFFVGENSSGKSTALALIRAAWDICYRMREPSFNEAPFFFGSFDNIASASSIPATSFSIGATIRQADGTEVATTAVFSNKRGRPAVASFTISSNSNSVTAHFQGDPVIEIASQGRHLTMRDQLFLQHIGFEGFGVGHLITMALFRLEHDAEYLKEVSRQNSIPSDIVLTMYRSIQSTLAISTSDWSPERPRAMSPIRPPPARTYEPTSDVQSPDNTHTPLTIRQMQSASIARKRTGLSLQQFGQSSGLFDSLFVRQFGHDSDSDPFQIMLKLSGQQGSRNLVDVGYGVNQVLPVAVDIVQKTRATTLIQQPEVHLHPRAQAALGTLLASHARPEQHIVVETHSDFLIDRVSVEIRRKTIDHNNVGLVFFDSIGSSGTKVHSLGYKSDGQLRSPPESYREFFIKEQTDFLTT